MDGPNHLEGQAASNNPKTPRHKRRKKKNNHSEQRRNDGTPSSPGTPNRKMPATTTPARKQAPLPTVEETTPRRGQQSNSTSPPNTEPTVRVRMDITRAPTTDQMLLEDLRQQNLLHDPDRTERTVFGSTTDPPAHAARYTSRFRVTPDTNNETALTLLAEEFFQTLWAADPTIKIWPWRSQTRRAPRTRNTNGALSFRMAQDYLDQLWPKRKQDPYFLYFSVFMSGSKPEQELLTSEPIQEFIDSHNSLLFRKEIQAPKTKTIGWGLYSTPSTDGNRLAKYFRDHHRMEIACRWRPILKSVERNGRTEYETGDENDRTFAIHFECAEEYQHHVRHLLQRTYPVSAEVFPLGITMRLVPHIFDCHTVRRKDTANYLVTRQRSFLDGIRSTKLYGVQNYQSPSPLLNNKSLLDLIQDIPNPDNPSRPLFLTVGPTNQSSSQLVVHYFQQYEQTASEIGTDMFAFLRSIIISDNATGDINRQILRALERFFTTDTIQLARNKVWDPLSKRMLGLEDIQMDDLTMGKGAFPEHQHPTGPPSHLRSRITLTNTPTMEQNHIENIIHRQEDDSIGTFRTNTSTHASSTSRPGRTPTESSLSSPSTDSTTFGHFLMQYGIAPDGRNSWASLSKGELEHLATQGAYLPDSARQRIQKVPPQPSDVLEEESPDEDSASAMEGSSPGNSDSASGSQPSNIPEWDKVDSETEQAMADASLEPAETPTEIREFVDRYATSIHNTYARVATQLAQAQIGPLLPPQPRRTPPPDSNPFQLLANDNTDDNETSHVSLHSTSYDHAGRSDAGESQ